MILLLLVPAALSGSALAAGLLTSRQRRLNRYAVLGGLAWALLLVIVVNGDHDPEVSAGGYIRGLLFAAGLMALLPWALYYALARAMVKYPIALALLWAASIVPLYYFQFLAFLLALDGVACPPDAYECPL